MIWDTVALIITSPLWCIIPKSHKKNKDYVYGKWKCKVLELISNSVGGMQIKIKQPGVVICINSYYQYIYIYTYTIKEIFSIVSNLLRNRFAKIWLKYGVQTSTAPNIARITSHKARAEYPSWKYKPFTKEFHGNEFAKHIHIIILKKTLTFCNDTTDAFYTHYTSYNG